MIPDPREALLALLSRYDPISTNDRQSCERIIDFVKSEPRCFERGTAIGHITGSAWLLDATHEQILLTHHRKLQKWFQLGGHADGENDILGVALREAQEESGIIGILPISDQIFDLDIHEIPSNKDTPAHLHFDIRFALQAPADARFAKSDESLDLAWVSLSALEEYSTEESLLRMRRKWLRGVTGGAPL